MIKMKKMPILIIVLMLIISIGFFIFQVSIIEESCKADISGVSGEVISLTGKQGYQPIHYFKDSDGEDNLNGIAIDSKETVNYTNEKGDVCSDYYVLKGDTSKLTSSIFSFGMADCNLTAEMQKFAEKGLLYVQGSIGISSKGGELNDQIKMKISQSGITNNEIEVSSSCEQGSTQWLKTDFIQVSSAGSITFYFSSLGRGNVLDGCDFLLYEPKLVFKTIIDNVNFETENQGLYPGEVLSLSANNEILNIEGSSNYMKYYRYLHKIEYEIRAGSNYASIIDGCLYVRDNLLENKEISIVAKSKKDSLSNEYVYSELKTFIIETKKYGVNISSDFTNPGVFYGKGDFYKNQKITISVEPKQGYIFKSWEINGKKTTDKRILYNVQEKNDIKCNFIKETKVLSISGITRYYNGDVSIDYAFVLDGVENYHNVELTGLTAKYINANAEKNKELILEGYPELIGKDSDLYKLTDIDIPIGYGEILPKPITVSANETIKSYGDGDEIITYSIDEQNISLNGKLSRTLGENVGVYDITLGNLQELNTNYLITLNTNKFIIEQRGIGVSDLVIENKVYDKTDSASCDYSIKNAVVEDDIGINLMIKFSTNQAGHNKMIVVKYELLGEDKNNYRLEEINDLYGEILQKDIKVVADSKKVIFGESADLTYTVEGLLDGDCLEGNLSRSLGDDVGEYSINLNDLGNINYKINYISSNYVISKRDVFVSAIANNKIYGDVDPKINYIIENGVDGVALSGNLNRESGENVGTYKVLLGSLNNYNYNINFESANFDISKRVTNIEIVINEKKYDGTTKATSSCTFSNLAFNDEISFIATLNFDNKNVGNDKQVSIENSYFQGENIENYEFNIMGNLRGNIIRQDVIINIDNKIKEYGENDLELTYQANGLIEGEFLVGEIIRESGEDVGNYEISINSITNENNSNYNIICGDISYLTIKPALLKIKAKDSSKIYGENDPVFEIELVENCLKYNDNISEVISGFPVRMTGNNPGKYQISKGTIQVSNNYQISEFIEGSFIIQKRDVKLKVVAQSKIYGDDDPNLTYTTENTIEGNDLKISLKREYGEDVGQYSITYISLSDSRYNIIFEGADLTINPRFIKIKADQKFKEYGDEDPSFTASIVEGELQNNDSISEIEQGSLIRITGENIGNYKILSGTYSLGKNYTFTYENNELTILPQEIEVKADIITKKYGNQDGELTYIITNGELKYEDLFSGALTREEGELVGEYTINQGSLCLNSNYNLRFIPSKMIIEKRPITILADPMYKTYGEEDPLLTYTIIGGVCFEDQLIGALDREKPTTISNPKLYEMAGKYLISSSLDNPNYNITYESNYLTIKQREIYITADNKIKTYGEEDPQLTYTITKGIILEGDSLSGDIYRVEGNNAGKYDIRSNLTLGRNYKIVFTKGVFEIEAIDIFVKTYNYEKIYGETNPVFEYVITSGELLNGDVLLGNITKEDGEDVGVYRLLSSFNNTNYKVILTENYLTINPKEAYLNLSIHDKVYNGDAVAYIKTPTVTGLIDNDIILSYDKENCARFATPDVGNNVRVRVYDILLSGEKSSNYILILPNEVYGNITNNCLENEKVGVLIKTYTNTDLSYGTELKASKDIDEQKITLPSNKQIVSTYNIWLENNSTLKEIKDTVSVRFEIPLEYRGRSNYYVYNIRDGKTELLNCTREDKFLEVSTDTLGEFIILSDNEIWLDISAYISIGLLGILAIWFIYRYVKKKIKTKNED